MANASRLRYSSDMVDARQFNIRDEHGHLLCPACGFLDYVVIEAYYETGGEPLGLCSCCLWEPGFDDGSVDPDCTIEMMLLAIRTYRAEWISTPEWEPYQGMNLRPWEKQRQLARLFEIAPHVQ